MTPLRAIAIGVAIAGVLFLPPWVPLITTGLLALRYFAWEAIIAGVVVDFLYLPGTFYGIPFPATLVMTAVVLLLIPWRQHLAVR